LEQLTVVSNKPQIQTRNAEVQSEEQSEIEQLINQAKQIKESAGDEKNHLFVEFGLKLEQI